MSDECQACGCASLGDAVLGIRVGKGVHRSPELVVGRFEGHGVLGHKLGLNLVEPELQQHGMVGTEGWISVFCFATNSDCEYNEY
jgi:hypothetical protein